MTMVKHINSEHFSNNSDQVFVKYSKNFNLSLSTDFELGTFKLFVVGCLLTKGKDGSSKYFYSILRDNNFDV